VSASGRYLSEWCGLWLETAGVNKLVPHIEADDAGIITEFSIEQSAPSDYPTIRPHRLAVGFYDLDDSGKLVRTHREELDVAGERTDVVSLVGLRRPELVLVNDDDLAYAKIRLDPVSLRSAKRHLKDFAHSLPRTLVWGAAWDAARDGETAARDYVELVLRNIGAESDSSVVLVLLRQLSTVLDYYVSQSDRSAIAEAAADSLWSLAEEAPAGSDSQLQFAKAFALRSRSAAQLEIVRGLFDGTRPLEGLEVDHDLRWELLTALVAGGSAGHAEIDAELERDHTATGQLAAELARAALPTPEGKRAAWEAVVAGGQLSNTQQRSAITGFLRVHNPTLLAPFAPEYFSVVRDVWDTKSYEIAQQIVVGLFPLAQTSEETLALTNAFLTDLGDDSPALRRLVMDSQAAVVRALAAQAADVERAAGLGWRHEPQPGPAQLFRRSCLDRRPRCRHHWVPRLRSRPRGVGARLARPARYGGSHVPRGSRPLESGR
jgi:aminopeptidase N